MDQNVEFSWVRVCSEQSSVPTQRENGRIRDCTRDFFITLGDDEALSEVEHVMSSHDTMKVRAILGAGRDDAKEVRNLNRYAHWNADGERSWIEYEPDPPHAELIVKSLNLECATGVTTPSVKKRLGEVLMTSPQLDAL